MEEINKKKFDYFLNVLPPIVFGKEQVICFLRDFDLNPIAESLKDFDDLFIQGEGWDNHNIYGVKKGKYFFIGNTLKTWSCEDFRYEDTGNFMIAKIENRLKEVVLCQ